MRPVKVVEQVDAKHCEIGEKSNEVRLYEHQDQLKCHCAYCYHQCPLQRLALCRLSWMCEDRAGCGLGEVCLRAALGRRQFESGSEKVKVLLVLAELRDFIGRSSIFPFFFGLLDVLVEKLLSLLNGLYKIAKSDLLLLVFISLVKDFQGNVPAEQFPFLAILKVLLIDAIKSPANLILIKQRILMISYRLKLIKDGLVILQHVIYLLKGQGRWVVFVCVRLYLNGRQQQERMQIAGVLEPPKRNKELTEKELKSIRMGVQKLSVNSKDGIFYGLVSKDSKSGFFSNDRLLVLSTKDREFFYLSKLPEGLIPFLSEAEVKSLKPKSKLTRQEIKNQQVTLFRCAPAPGKISSFQIEFKKAGQVEQWLFTAGNSKAMHEWAELINTYLLQDEPRPKTPEKQEPKQNIQISESLPKAPEQRLARPLSESKPLQADTIPQQPVPPPRLPQGNTLNHSSSFKAYDSRIANMPYSDHASELKYLRKENPGLFQLSNDLSKPKLREDQPENNQNRLNTQPSRSLKFPEQSNEYEVDSRLIVDSHIDDSKAMVRAPSGKEDAFKRSKNEPVQREVVHTRYPSRKELDPYSRSREEEPQVKILSAVNNRGAMANREEYEPVIARGNSRTEQRNIVIREDEEQEQERIIREPKPAPQSRKASSRNAFASRGSGRRWNQAFAQGSRRLQAYEQFVEAGFNLVRSIVNELPLERNQREYLPLQAKTPYFTYYSQGILVALHFFQSGRSVSSSGPLLYEQESCELIKREFYNYNLVLSVTGNEGFIKVPLCAYFEYKGVIAVCKAELPEGFTEVTPKRYERQFDIIENQIHVRFMYGSFNAYLHHQGKYLILDNLRELIPQLPLPAKQQHFFRKEFLLTYAHIIEDMDTASEAYYNITHQALPECLAKLEGLETYAVSSADLARVLHQGGLSLSYLPLLLQQSHAPHLKKLLTTQLAVSVFQGIFRSQLHHLVATFPRDQPGDISLETANQALLDSCQALLELIFGYSNNAQAVWRVVVEQCGTRFKVALSKEDLLPGYLFSSLLQRFGLICDFRRSSFSKHAVQFFVSSGNIPRDLLIGFRVRTRRYDLPAISPLVREVEEILADEPSADNFRQLVGALRLKEEGLAGYLESFEPALLAYLCNFVPYGEHEEFQHLGIYNLLVLEPPCYWGAKIGLLAVKWCVKKRLSEEATRIYELKQAENAFWLGEHNPAAGELYDFFAMYHASLGRYEEAVGLARLSLKNIGKVLGVGELPVADKHYQLGNIFFKMGRKDDALRQYTRTRELLAAHGQTSIAEFGVILLKLGVLYLNFGKVAECVQSALEALRIFEETGRSEADEIGTFELLARCYEITKKTQELLRLGDLVAEKFNSTQDPQTFERMAKLVLYSRIGALSSPQGKAFSAIISKLQEQQARSSTQAFTFLHRKSQSDVLMRKVTHFLDNITSLYQQASRSDLFRRFRSLDPQTRSQPQEMLVVLQALGAMIGFGYLRGSLRDQ